MATETTDKQAAPAPSLTTEVETLKRELTEIDMLINQARAEAARHEQKRSQASDKLGSLSSAGHTDPKELLELNSQLVNLTRRAALMEAQVEVLEGKRKALARFHESLSRHSTTIEQGDKVAREQAAADTGDVNLLPPAMSRFVLTAQEELRREIARAMHDGPAQSLTNIVLQAQIVERLLSKDPEQARQEVRLLIAMVQQTLDATKSFIFDVRPMVLDDLGLVPTLRRAARDRGRRAGINVDFESQGADRRLPMEVESGVFRILDEALSAYLAAKPDALSLRIDWSDQVEARVSARRADAGRATTPKDATAPSGKEVPPALAAMMEDRKADHDAAVEAARQATIVALPPAAWREIKQRAGTIDVTVEMLDEGGTLRVVVPADLTADEG